MRIRSSVLRLNGSDVKVAYVARSAGYKSEVNFYVAFEKNTGMTPSALRALEPAGLEHLLQGRLEIGLARLFEVRHLEAAVPPGGPARSDHPGGAQPRDAVGGSTQRRTVDAQPVGPSACGSVESVPRTTDCH